ncbi:dienelactone hydrolase family protein [Algoriphagus antarcticus]|uniref:Dienelactone hydrolase n=1 Tax=Algoriphagus antarcticus TaxID=238540 RepID=A0A3E0DI05_9BACT|nr:dienelactone hydrolase family protein [Algoriphagus antarcticus]REG81403.1 dienelactone hydrolase [Algoriphagus antarcticus]
MGKTTQIDAYAKETFSFTMSNEQVATHDVYTIGQGNKVVIIIQELPGIGQETLALADKFIEQRYVVVLPHLFGPIGKTAITSNLFRVVCMRKEFSIFSKNESSPIVDYLSGLCTLIKERYQVKGVAVIGMCLTGNFAISLMANDAVLAGFASQPSLPILNSSAIHMSAGEISAIKAKLDLVGPMHCGRFEGDILCTAKKFEVLDKTFNTDDKERIIFHELPGKGHAILTLEFVDKAGHPTRKTFDEVVGYFDQQLT